MNPNTNSSLRSPVMQVMLATGIISLIPYLGLATTFTDGLRLGPNATTNPDSTGSIFLGLNNTNAAPNAIALGQQNNLGGTTGGWAGIAAGRHNTLGAEASMALGHWNSLNGPYSLAVGHTNTTSGAGSIAYGYISQAAHHRAMAGGAYTIAAGLNSVALGEGTEATSRGSMTIGTYNEKLPGESDPAASTEWRDTDPLFVIGNGRPTTTEGQHLYRRNAFIVLKNGTVIIPKKHGGISMGNYQ